MNHPQIFSHNDSRLMNATEEHALMSTQKCDKVISNTLDKEFSTNTFGQCGLNYTEGATKRKIKLVADATSENKHVSNSMMIYAETLCIYSFGRPQQAVASVQRQSGCKRSLGLSSDTEFAAGRIQEKTCAMEPFRVDIFAVLGNGTMMQVHKHIASGSLR